MIATLEFVGTQLTGGALGTASHTHTIEDDDATAANPLITISGGSAVTEGTAASFTVNANPAPSTTKSVSVTVSEDTSGGQEFVAVGNVGTHPVSIPTSGTATLSIPTVGDSTAEPNGAVTATVHSGSGYTVGNPSSAMVTVNDDDTAATLSISGPASAPEGDSGTRDLTYTVSLSEAISGNVSWRVCFTGTATRDTNGGAVDASADYQARAHTNPSPQCTPDQALGVSYNPPTTNSNIFIRVKGDTDPESDETVVATLSIIGSNSAGVILGTSVHTHTIEDDDTPAATNTLTLTLASTSAAEGDSSSNDVNVTVTKPAAVGGVAYTLCFSGDATLDQNGTKVAGEDYQVINDDGTTVQTAYGSGAAANCVGGIGTVNMAAGTDSATWKIRVFGDTDVESSETVIVTLGESTSTPLPANVEISSTGNPATYTITDDDTPVQPAVTVKFSSAAYSVTEGGNVEVGVTLSGTRTTPTEIPIIPLGISATGQGSDFDSSDFTITVPAGQTAATGMVSTTKDSSVEGDETFSLSFGTLPDGVAAGTPSAAQVTIVDDDFPKLSLELASSSGAEGNSGNSDVTVTIRLSDSRTAATAFKFCVKNTGTATFRTPQASRDFDVMNFFGNTQLSLNSDNCHNYSIAGGSTSSQVKLRIFGDTRAEPDETAVLELRDPPAGVVISKNAGRATYTIENDEAARLTLTALDGSALSGKTLSETDDPVEFLLNIAPNFKATGVVFLRVSGRARKRTGRSYQQDDYVLEIEEGKSWNPVSSSLIFPPRGASSVKLRVVPLADSRTEKDESIAISLRGYNDNYGGPAYTTGSPRSVSFTLTSTDKPKPKASFAAAESTHGENAGIRNVTVNLSEAAPAGGLTLAYSVSSDSTATEGAGNDYTIANKGTVTMAKGATSASIPVKILEDTEQEMAETVILKLTAAADAGYTVDQQKPKHTLTIADNDTPAVTPGVTISTDTLALTEGGTAKSYTVALDSKPTADVTVTARIATADKIEIEGPQGPDDTTPGSRATLTFTPTTWSQAQTVTVKPVDDNDDRYNETVTIVHHVSATGGYDGVTAGSVTVTVDDDEPPLASTLSVSVAPVKADESDAGGKTYAAVSFVLEPTRSQATGFKACLKSTGTAARGSSADYLFVGKNSDTPLSLDGNGCHSATIAANGDSLEARLLIRGDGDVEPDETVVVELRDPPSGVTLLGSPELATYTIRNDDNSCVPADLLADVRGYAAETQHGPGHVRRWNQVLAAFGKTTGETAMSAATAKQFMAQHGGRWNPVVPVLECIEGGGGADPVVTVTGGDAVTEGGNAVFTVHANPAPAANLDVTVTVADDAASDFLIPAREGSHTVTVKANQNTRTLTLATTKDSTHEADGVVTATVASGTGYRVGTASTATVAVNDDDPAPVTPVVKIAAAAGSITEGGAATFNLIATPAPPASIMVEVLVSQTGSFAQSGQTGTKMVTVGTNGKGTLTVTTAQDETHEPNGSITAVVQAGTGYDPSDMQASASVTVVDNDDPPVVSIAGGGKIVEGGTASFTLTATPAPAGTISVRVEVKDLSGHAPGQSRIRNETVGTSGTRTFSVPTQDDGVDRSDGPILATVRAGTGYTPSKTEGSASVRVTDNDVASGFPTITVSDATADESAGRMVFTVSLNRELEEGESVHFLWETRDSKPRSARPGVDYYPRYGSTRFRPGERETQYTVPIIDDSHDDGGETFELHILYPLGAAIAKGVGVGTITNSDPMPAAWLARFGRTAAEQALDGIAGRMAASRTAGMQGAIAGQALSFGNGSGGSGAANDNVANDNALPGASIGSAGFGGSGGGLLAPSGPGIAGDRPGSGPGQAFGNGPGSGFGAGSTQSRTMTGLEALLGSSFTATGEKDGTGGSMAFWGRAAQSRFDGREGTFSLDGETTTGMLGADYARGKWLVGMALMQSSGEGKFADSNIDPRAASQTCPEGEEREVPCGKAVRTGDGKVEASLTAAVPYAAIQASERLKLWGAAGYGTGEVTLKPALGDPLKADISWTMAAAGMRGDVIAPPKEGSGPALALTSDALWARTSSDRTHELAASDSDVTRLRLGLEGSWKVALEGDGSVTPKLEIGARHDGGDAETGFGIELGGGIAWMDPRLGLSLDLSGRTLVAHGSDDLEDRGFAASFAFDPDPATKRGPSLTLRQDWGGQAKGGLDALFRTDPLEDRSGSGPAPESRWQAEAAWGFPAFGGRFTGSPHVGLGLATGARDYSLGWRLTPAANANVPDVSFGLKATRRENDTAAPEHTFGFEVNARW